MNKDRTITEIRKGTNKKLSDLSKKHGFNKAKFLTAIVEYTIDKMKSKEIEMEVVKKYMEIE